MTYITERTLDSAIAEGQPKRHKRKAFSQSNACPNGLLQSFHLGTIHAYACYCALVDIKLAWSKAESVPNKRCAEADMTR